MILSRSIAGPEQRETTKPYSKTGLLDRPDRPIAMGVRERGAGLPGQHSAPVRPDADTFPANMTAMRTILLLMLLSGALCGCANPRVPSPQSLDARALCQQQ